MSFNLDIPKQISIPIQADENGFTGRECPQKECEGYFKVKFGTGLKGENLPCHCPYCGHMAQHDQFYTKEQIKYAESVAMREITQAFHRELKKLEFNHPARGPLGIGISMKVKPGAPIPLKHYREKRLETEITCDQCTLQYAIYGVFAYCPDCGAHNSPQILSKNMELAIKELDLAMQIESSDLKQHLIDDSLENVVSAFDGFGREIVRVNAHKATAPDKAEYISFQNLENARKNLQALFSFDLASSVDIKDWELAIRCFSKRHLLAHKMGVVDQKYIGDTNDTSATIGRRIKITEDEVHSLVLVVQTLGKYLAKEVSK
ncbi:MAG: hypothetical protein GYA34_18385 [Chloroflexi bacterium]|nr:hypothetical protein [Chloroflexota bacterium]